MSFFERLKTKESAEWRAYTEHPFTDGLADGSLPEAAFRHYLAQDYLFLIEFARAYALSVCKSPKLADMHEAAAGLADRRLIGERLLACLHRIPDFLVDDAHLRHLLNHPLGFRIRDTRFPVSGSFR
ncbi:hypothetical protein ABIC03_005924 [Bradyrhizobium sp. RT6a]